MVKTLSTILVISHLIFGGFATEFQFLNNFGKQIWVGTQGNDGKPAPNGGGLVLAPGQRATLNVADDWAGRFWPRTGCNWGNQHCETGDCGNKLKCNGAGGAPPVSLAEITLKGSGGLDYYDISLVDGFNVGISFEPLRGKGDGTQYSCKKAQCTANINGECPKELKLVANGQTVACQSACTAFNTDEYCCRGSHGTPDTCKSTDWPHDYPKFFKDRCPDAYSYAYDDHKSTFTCMASAYLITFS